MKLLIEYGYNVYLLGPNHSCKKKIISYLFNGRLVKLKMNSLTVNRIVDCLKISKKYRSNCMSNKQKDMIFHVDDLNQLNRSKLNDIVQIIESKQIFYESEFYSVIDKQQFIISERSYRKYQVSQKINKFVQMIILQPLVEEEIKSIFNCQLN